MVRVTPHYIIKPSLNLLDTINKVLTGKHGLQLEGCRMADTFWAIPPTAGQSPATVWCYHVNMDHTFEGYFQQRNEPHKRESNPALARSN